MQLAKFLLIGITMLFFSCNSEKENKTAMRFAQVPMSVTNIEFANHIIENDTLNYFSFPYLYLGAGVSVGDINNDGLSDIYFTGNLVSNRLYLNKGNLEFEDITESAGVGGDNRWYTGTTLADVNNDGFLDIYTSVSGKSGIKANQLFINNGNNTFSEEADTYGIADKGNSIQSTFFDYDNDGLLDLFVANYPIVLVSMGNLYYYEKMLENKVEDSGHLYRNNGNGTFTDVTFKAGLQRFGLTLGLVATDFNNDGFKDLYLSNDFNVPDYLYQNNGNGTFTEISKIATRHTSMFGMGMDAADFNNDGLMDLMQLDMTAEDYKRSKTNMASMSPETFYEAVDLGFNYQYMQNSLQLNNGISNNSIPIFSDISRFANMSSTDWSWGVVFADFDNDGWKDVFISNGVKRDVNNNDVLAAYDSETFFGKSKNPDFRLMPSTPLENYAFKNNGDYTFSNTTQNWALDQKGFSNGFAYSDLDNDGDLDLVINNMNATASVYENEQNDNENHYLRIKLIGNRNNPFGIGAKVEIKTKDLKQIQELTLTRGYQSSVEPILHFGIGKEKQVDTLVIVWPNGIRQTITDIQSDQVLEVVVRNADSIRVGSQKTYINFKDITVQAGIDFIHKEDEYDDFATEPLLPHRNSKLGPALAVGDVNGDGLDDFFVGNASGSSGAMYAQNDKGEFTTLSGPWEQDMQYEDTGALLFDADNDSDLDLYVVNGGNDTSKPASFYQDRLYLNTDNGFVKSKNVLPFINSSGQEIATGDFDADGDLDLFIGGRIVPGRYPYPANSYILRNDGGKDLLLMYSDVTMELAPELNEAGLVTSALWDDFNLDGKLDLIITGEWMPIRFFKNIGDGFEEVTNELGFQDTKGWWYSLQKVDIDLDGDMDYLAGNLGLNYKYKASEKVPFEVYANDFDENGTTDIVLSYKKDGTQLPLRGRECSSQQVPAIKQRFKTFESFANADLEDIYGKAMLKKALHYKANTFAHHWIENNGDGTFEMHILPYRSQFSSINSFEIFDFNNDNYPDILSGGNLYNAEVETPRNDAGIGLLLKGSENGLEVVEPSESGLFITGEIRKIAYISIGKKRVPGFLIAPNNTSIKLLAIKKE